jgi:hypothetical protein
VRADGAHDHEQRQDRAEGLSGQDHRAVEEGHLDKAAEDPPG